MGEKCGNRDPVLLLQSISVVREEAVPLLQVKKRAETVSNNGICTAR